MLYLQNLIVCSSSVGVADYSCCVFKLLLVVILRCTAPDYPFGSSKSCLSFFYVRRLSTSFVTSNHYCLSFSVYGPWLLILYFKLIFSVLLRCAASDYSLCIFKLFVYVLLRCRAADYSFCIFKPLLSVLLRCTVPDSSFCIFKLFLYVLLRCTTPAYPLCIFKLFLSVLFGVRPLITPFYI